MSRVLIVDDSRVMREILREELEKNGHRVAGEAANGREAIGLFKKEKPDAVLMDLTMDEMDGFEAIRQIRALEPNSVIIVVSALCEGKVISEAKRLGAAAYLAKPFTPEEFKNCLERNL